MLDTPILYHLSHIDLDGYSCQLITKEAFGTIHYYNANYGQEVMDKLSAILKAIDSAPTQKSLILISDLNLSLNEAKFIDGEVAKRAHVDILLLDHHGTGQKAADTYEWYYLDTSRSATKIVYAHACQHWDLSEGAQEWLAPYVDIVNAVDLWKMHEKVNFEYGKVCMRLVVETRELNRYMFDEDDRNYKFTLLQEAAQMAHVDDAPIKLDDAIHSMKKAFFRREKNGTLDALATTYVVKRIGDIKEQLKLTYRGYTGLVTYALGNTSILGNGILKAYDDIDFVLDIGPRGSMSLRADNGVDVSTIAGELAGGGGHPNASGARIQGFKEYYIYEDVKAYMQELFKQKEKSSQLPQK